MRGVYYRILDAIAPPLSIRRQFLALIRSLPAILFQRGPGAMFDDVSQAFGNYRTKGALLILENGTATTESYPALTYPEWIAAFEPSDDEILLQKRSALNLPHRPLISIIIPVFDPPVDVLQSALDSVCAQSYAHWQLCIAEGGSTDPAIADLLRQYKDEEPRINVTYLHENRGISGNSNAALELAQGEFVALMDHDDTVAPNMLVEIVATLNQHPDTDILYFDEDKLSADGTIREHPWFKPDFSPDMMLSTNLLMHGVFRRTLIYDVGGFDAKTDGAQDWDLALRCTEHTSAIYHIPKVLYHWRQIAGSASVDAAAKPYAFDAQTRALENHVLRIDGVRPRIEFPELGSTHVVWPTTDAPVSVIIPNKDNLTLVRACIDSLFAQTSHQNIEIVLVDTGSQEDGTHEYYERLLRKHDNVRLAHDNGDFNYSRANNIGATAATGDYLLFLNNDTEALHPDWLHELVGWASRDKIGVVGAKLIRPSGLIQHAGIIMGLAGHGSNVFEDMPENSYTIFGSTEWVRNVHALTGACMMMPARLFRELGGFDEVYQIGYSDIELCLRAEEAGYRNVYTPFALLLHHEGGSRGFYLPPSDVLRATAQFLPMLQQTDRFFNPNLSPHHRKPSLRNPDAPSQTETVIDIVRVYGLFPRGASSDPALVTDFDLPQPLSWPAAEYATSSAGSTSDLSILFITHDLSLSGAPLLLASLAAELTILGVSITLYSPKDGPVREIYADSGVPVRIGPSHTDSANDATVLASEITRHDMVIANTIVTSAGIHVATAYDKPSILWLHESHYGRDLAAHDSGTRAALRNASLVILPTLHLAELYGEYIPSDRYVVLPYGLDTDYLVAPSPALTLAPDKVHVVNIGSLERRKGQEFLVASIKKLPRQLRQRMEFHFLGRTIDPDYVSALHRSSAKLPNVHFVGEVDHDQTMAYLDAADIFVLSSRDEVLPVSMLEAMYHGKAIIATDVGGVSEAIENGENGYIVEFGDKRALARILGALAEDATLRQQIGSRAAAVFRERYTMQIYIKHMTDLLARVTQLPVSESTAPHPDSIAEPSSP